MAERKRIENLDDLVGKTISRVDSNDRVEYLTLIFDDDSFLHVTPQEHWLGRSPWLKLDEDLESKIRTIHMDGMTHEAPARLSGCCNLIGRACEKCGGFSHFQPVYGGCYYQCEDCGEKSF